MYKKIMLARLPATIWCARTLHQCKFMPPWKNLLLTQRFGKTHAQDQGAILNILKKRFSSSVFILNFFVSRTGVLASYYLRFIEGFARILISLTEGKMPHVASFQFRKDAFNSQRKHRRQFLSSRISH